MIPDKRCRMRKRTHLFEGVTQKAEEMAVVKQKNDRQQQL